MAERQYQPQCGSVSRPNAKLRIFLVTVVAAVSIGAKDKAAAADPGPDPTWEGGVRLVEAALRERLIDPQSAQIEWPYNFTSGSLKSLFGKRRAGWFTCGRVNARNRMGGYTGRVWFLAMINSGVVVDLDIGTADGVDAASATCPGLIAKGQLPAAPVVSAPPATAEAFLTTANKHAAEAALRGGLGIAFLPTVHGALLISVAAGSPAGRAGLKPGETIAQVNGIALGGLDQSAMVRIFAGTGNRSEVEVVGVGKLLVERTPK